MADNSASDDTPPPYQPRRASDQRGLIEQISNQQITERFNGIGIDDSSFEAKQRTIANFILLNSLREAKESRDARLKRSVWSVLTTIAQNAAWVVALAAATWLFQAFRTGNFPSIFK